MNLRLNRRVSIITDAASGGDDVVAIASLIISNVNIDSIVTTSGNTWSNESKSVVEKLLSNFDNINVPVYEYRDAEFEQWRISKFQSELFDVSYAGALRNPKHQVQLELEEIKGRSAHYDGWIPEGVTDIILIGPATFLSHIWTIQALPSSLQRIYIMGGSLRGPGNASQGTEFNFWFDAFSAETVLSAEVPITLLPYDVTREVSYGKRFSDSVAARKLTDRIGPVKFQFICDEILSAIYLNPNIVHRSERASVKVLHDSNGEYGQLVSSGESNKRKAIDLITEINVGELWKTLRSVFYRAGDYFEDRREGRF